MTNVPAILNGTTITLRKSSASDAASLFPIMSDADVMRNMLWATHRNLAETLTFLAECELRWQSGEEYQWTIFDNSNQQTLGCVASKVEGHVADLGYFLGRHAWGRGVASEAATLVLDWLKAQPEIYRIWATTDIANDKSGRVLEKLGLVREGILHRAHYRPNIGGAPRDTVLYAYWKAAD